MEKRRTHAIVNPVSANGRTRKEWPRLLSLIQSRWGEINWEWTHGPGHATEITLKALREGCDRILSVGGDGTHHEVANAFFISDDSTHPQAVLAALARGTGSDFTRSLGIPRDAKAAMDVLAQDRVASIDAGWCLLRDPEGRDHQRTFLNITSMGISGEVDLRVNRTSKVLGGFISFLWGTLATVLTYRAKEVRFSLDGGPWRQEKIMLIAVANGQYFGGGMWVAPTAQLDDGEFRVIIIREMGRLELLYQLNRLYKGTHLTHPKVEEYRARTVAADSQDKVWLDVDGEPLGTLPGEFRMLPNALKVLVGPGFRSKEREKDSCSSAESPL